MNGHNPRGRSCHLVSCPPPPIDLSARTHLQVSVLAYVVVIVVLCNWARYMSRSVALYASIACQFNVVSLQVPETGCQLFCS
ncbi:hypothetical protein TcWFU_003248 [Taenia crassiceps]|uniref:Uncharacterized protein n=1 Tax=Taenia crassiceps TaxID=6207 RepID=A0ABR4QCV2_9CEST